MTLTQETALAIHGEMRKVPPAQHAPLDHELHVDYFTVIGIAAGDQEAITDKVQEGADPQTVLDNRHLVLRGEKASSVMKVRAAVLHAFHQTYVEQRCLEVTPPHMVQTQVEGGATLFKFDYYGQDAYLTQSSQLYLGTCLPSLGDVFCVAPSFRTEKSLFVAIHPNSRKLHRSLISSLSTTCSTISRQSSAASSNSHSQIQALSLT
jgi:asparaginyl-tRNA synthetase